jgi:hypothetical protein
MPDTTDRKATPDEIRDRIENVAEKVTTAEDVLRLNASLRRLLGINYAEGGEADADGLCEEDITSVHLWTGRMMDVISEANRRGEWVW